jgi:hypothetical protein
MHIVFIARAAYASLILVGVCCILAAVCVLVLIKR